jgi:hypothetical protein
MLAGVQLLLEFIQDSVVHWFTFFMMRMPLTLNVNTRTVLQVIVVCVVAFLRRLPRQPINPSSSLYRTNY